MPKGYCVKCNRNKPKGEWVETEIAEPIEEKTYQTKKGTKRFIKGKCPTCGSTVMKIIGK